MVKAVNGLVVAVLVCYLLVYDPNFVHGSTRGDKGMFSWKKDAFQHDGTQLFSFMKRNGFVELYQSFSSDLDDSEISSFLSKAKKEKIDVYVLVGDPSWALDPRGKKMRETVEKIAEIRRVAGGGIKGIVFDVEPQTLPEWKENAGDMMDSFVSGMKRAYREATGEGFEVIICIPYYYDDEGVNAEMKALIRTGCDRIAIMNYHKSQEAEHIKNEMKYAQRYGKGVINVFEFKPSGQRGLTEINTYFLDGFAAALTSFGVIAATYPDADLILAAHDYEALKGVLK